MARKIRLTPVHDAAKDLMPGKIPYFTIEPKGLHIDCGFLQFNHEDEPICGDYYRILDTDEGQLLVLSDGQGSGVRANIPATLTASMLGRMIAGKVPLNDAVSAVADTLPVNSVSGLAYATFTVLEVEEQHMHLLQFDNPDAVLIRNGVVTDYPIEHLTSEGKEIHESTLDIQEGDVLIITSDAVSNAGMGKLTGDGWARKDYLNWLSRKVKPDMPARELAANICAAVQDLNEGTFDDDLTVLVLKFIKANVVNLMIGPPSAAKDDEIYMRGFFHLEGQHVVCGGTTSKVAADYLGTTVHIKPDTDTDGVPCYLRIDGVDLATEGQITLDRLMDYVEEIEEDPLAMLSMAKVKNGASLLGKKLFLEASEVNLFFGNASNKAYEEGHPGEQTKQETVEMLIACLRRQGIPVNVKYWDHL